MQKNATQLTTEISETGKKISQKILDYFFNLARKSFFRLGKIFVVPDLEGREQLPHVKIKYFLVENSTYKEENAWHRQKLLQLAKKLSETKKTLSTATRQIAFLNYQLSRAGIIFENSKRETKEKELEINLLKEVIANHFTDQAIALVPGSLQAEKPRQSEKRARLLLKAQKCDLPKIADGFGGKKTVFSNAFLEELFEGGLCEKLTKKIVTSIKELCQHGATFNRSFDMRPLNGKVRTVPEGSSIGNLTNKYRLIFKIDEKNGTIVFHKFRHRDDSTYR